MAIILWCLLVIVAVLAYYFRTDRRRILKWLELKQDFNDRAARYPKDADYQTMLILVSRFAIICDDLAISKVRDGNKNMILCMMAGEVTEELEMIKFFEKTDELDERTED